MEAVRRGKTEKGGAEWRGDGEINGRGSNVWEGRGCESFPKDHQLSRSKGSLFNCRSLELNCLEVMITKSS